MVLEIVKLHKKYCDVNYISEINRAGGDILIEKMGIGDINRLKEDPIDIITDLILSRDKVHSIDIEHKQLDFVNKFNATIQEYNITYSPKYTITKNELDVFYKVKNVLKVNYTILRKNCRYLIKKKLRDVQYRMMHGVIKESTDVRYKNKYPVSKNELDIEFKNKYTISKNELDIYFKVKESITELEEKEIVFRNIELITQEELDIYYITKKLSTYDIDLNKLIRNIVDKMEGNLSLHAAGFIDMIACKELFKNHMKFISKETTRGIDKHIYKLINPIQYIEYRDNKLGELVQGIDHRSNKLGEAIQEIRSRALKSSEPLQEIKSKSLKAVECITLIDGKSMFGVDLPIRDLITVYRKGIEYSTNEITKEYLVNLGESVSTNGISKPTFKGIEYSIQEVINEYRTYKAAETTGVELITGNVNAAEIAGVEIITGSIKGTETTEAELIDKTYKSSEPISEVHNKVHKSGEPIVEILNKPHKSAEALIEILNKKYKNAEAIVQIDRYKLKLSSAIVEVNKHNINIGELINEVTLKELKQSDIVLVMDIDKMNNKKLIQISKRWRYKHGDAQDIIWLNPINDGMVFENCGFKEAKISFKAYLDYILFIESLLHLSVDFYYDVSYNIAIEDMTRVLYNFLIDTKPEPGINEEYEDLFRVYKRIADAKMECNDLIPDPCVSLDYLKDGMYWNKPERTKGAAAIQSIINDMTRYFELYWGKRVIDIYSAPNMDLTKDHSYIDRVKGRRHPRYQLKDYYKINEFNLPFNVEEDET